MAVIAGIAAGQVSWIFAGRGYAIVTRAASADNLSVVNGVYWRPSVGVMAIFANVACLNVCEILARRRGAIVAVNAVIREIRMVEVRGQPANGRVTVVAIITAGDMRRGFADGRDAIMTGSTSTQYLRMVNRERRCPYIRGVAVLTNIGCEYMCCVLADCINAIVAADTVARDIYVIEISRQPASR